jgi:hypothetical protein
LMATVSGVWLFQTVVGAPGADDDWGPETQKGCQNVETQDCEIQIVGIKL